MKFDANQIINKLKKLPLKQQLAYGAIILGLILIISGILFF